MSTFDPAMVVNLSRSEVARIDPARCLRSAASILRARRTTIRDLDQGHVFPECEFIARRTIEQEEDGARVYLRLAVLAGRARAGVSAAKTHKMLGGEAACRSRARSVLPAKEG